MYRFVIAAALLLPSPALADAFTYAGTLGKAHIVVEFTSDPQKPQAAIAGRYFYVNKGIDIPLDAATGKPGELALAEEAPCTEACKVNDDATVTGYATAANWTLVPSADGKSLAGAWTATGRSLPIALTFKGTRPLPADAGQGPAALEAIVLELTSGDRPITEHEAPYDYLRMQAALTKGLVTEQAGSAFQYVSDPRVKFDFPRIVKLAGGADPSRANGFLEQHHWQMLSDALSCEAQQYAAFGWNDMMPNFAGTYASYPDEQIEVLSVSPTLMSYVEGGSLDCGGPHPYNHHEFTTFDVKTGEPVHFEAIFKDWIPSDFDGNPVGADYAKAHPEEVRWGPGDALFAFVKAHLKDAPDAALDDSDCDYDDLIRHNLAVAIKPGDRLLFTLDGLEYAIQACASDIFEAPVTELRNLLAPTAGDYFPVLKR